MWWNYGLKVLWKKVQNVDLVKDECHNKSNKENKNNTYQNMGVMMETIWFKASNECSYLLTIKHLAFHMSITCIILSPLTFGLPLLKDSLMRWFDVR
jgi:hypothetical protein